MTFDWLNIMRGGQGVVAEHRETESQWRAQPARSRGPQRLLVGAAVATERRCRGEGELGRWHSSRWCCPEGARPPPHPPRCPLGYGHFFGLIAAGPRRRVRSCWHRDEREKMATGAASQAPEQIQASPSQKCPLPQHRLELVCQGYVCLSMSRVNEAATPGENRVVSLVCLR